MQRSLRKLGHDILQACEELKAFTGSKELEDLECDRGLQLILEREFEIIGEALYRMRGLDEVTFDRISQGHRIIGTRNLLAHGYDIVEHVILWDALHQDLPILENEIRQLLESC